jgi:oligopeptide/dipeptide ABC transporter ATP-binding protein
MALIETIFLISILIIGFYIIYKLTPRDSRINVKSFGTATIISCLICLGIVFGIKILFQILEYSHIIFTSFYKDPFLFGLEVLFFAIFYQLLVSRKNHIISKAFKKWSRIYVILCLILSLLFISIDLLDISGISLYVKPLDRAMISLLLSPLDINDIFYLSFISEFGIVFFCIFLTYFINRIRDIEARITRIVLKKSLIISGFITYFSWSFLTFLFGAYLGNLLNTGGFFLDIRVQIVINIGIYFVTFFYFLKYRYLSESGEISQQRLQRAIKKKEEDRKEQMKDLVLKVEDLKTYFYTEEGVVKALENVSFEIKKGEVLGLVGETGCGKTVTALSVLQIIRDPGVIEAGKVFYKGEDLLRKNEEEMLKYRGKEITMIFQDPLLSLNPVFKIGKQISEVYLLNMEEELTLEALKHPNKSIYGVARDWSVKMLKNLNIPNAENIYDRFPHELSGGMRQRVQIAMALACSPSLLIADEPTTALDVTIQNQILKLMIDLLKEYETSILFITHDLGIISKVSDKVGVMYSGYVVEYGIRKKLFRSPLHPYTKALLKSIPKVGEDREKLEVIEGSVPNLIYPPSGCRFHPRCPFRFGPCDSIVPIPIEIEQNYYVSCHLYDPKYKDDTVN